MIANSSPTLLKAKEIVFRLLKFRPRSEKEIRDKLQQKKIPEETIEQAIAYFKQLQLLDDRQFAQNWIRTRLRKPLGLTRIRFELKTKGVPDNIIKEELESNFDAEAEYEIVLDLAKRRATKYQRVEPLKRKRRLFEYLARRGFNSGIIQKVIKNL